MTKDPVTKDPVTKYPVTKDPVTKDPIETEFYIGDIVTIPPFQGIHKYGVITKIKKDSFGYTFVRIFIPTALGRISVRWHSANSIEICQHDFKDDDLINMLYRISDTYYEPSN